MPAMAMLALALSVLLFRLTLAVVLFIPRAWRAARQGWREGWRR